MIFKGAIGYFFFCIAAAVSYKQSASINNKTATSELTAGRAAAALWVVEKRYD